MVDKYVIVTGATGGIGSQLTKLCIDNNVNTRGCFIYKDQNKFNDIFSKYSYQKFDTYLYNMDIVDKIDIQALLSKNTNQTVILVLTSFTIEPLKKVSDQDISQITKNININIISQLNIIIEVLRYTKDNNIELKIVNIDSGAAYRPIYGWSLYSSSKSYMNMFLKSLQLEEKMKIVTYDPGIVNTHMQEIIRDQDGEKYNFVNQFKEYYANGDLNDPYEVTNEIWNRYIIDWKANKFEERFNQ